MTEKLKKTTGVRLCACCACVFYRLLVKNTGSLKVTESTCAKDARAQFLGSAWWRHRLEADDAEGGWWWTLDARVWLPAIFLASLSVLKYFLLPQAINCVWLDES